MDNKQKKSILISTYKGLIFFSLLAIGWIGYFSIQNISNEIISENYNLLWLNIILVVLSFFLFIFILAVSSRMRKLNNLFSVSKFLYFIIFNTIAGISAGLFVMYYTKQFLCLGYYSTIGVLIFTEILSILLLVIAVHITKLNKSTTISIDPIEEVPNFDDELMLKKQLDELNRKKEMKKVVDEIESIKKELGEN